MVQKSSSHALTGMHENGILQFRNCIGKVISASIRYNKICPLTFIIS